MRQNAQFSLLMARKKAVQRANAAILEAAWTPVDYRLFEVNRAGARW